MAEYRRRSDNSKGKDVVGTDADNPVVLDAYIQDPSADDFECHFLGGEYRFGLNENLSSA